MSVIPIVLFTYNRPKHTRATVDALKANIGAAEAPLYVYSDGPKTAQHAPAVDEVRAYLKTIDGFKSVTVTERPRNMGLAASVIAGVTEMLDKYSAVTVMEDDMITSRIFLRFMNAALTTYAGRADIFSVTGYNYPLAIPRSYPGEAYLSYRGSSWGWGTWSDRWRKVDWEVKDFQGLLADWVAQKRFARGGADLLPMLKKQMAGELDSWSIRFDYAHAKHDAFCVHPVRSKLRNIGFDGSGVHCDVSNDYDVELDDDDRTFVLPPDLRPDPKILRIFDQHFGRSPSLGPVRAVVSLIKRVLRRAVRGLRPNRSRARDA